MTTPKGAEIRALFSNIAPKYDLANSALSFGWHHLWRRQLASEFPSEFRGRILDLATGTGDVALALQRRLGSRAQITGADFAEPMLDLARKKSSGIEPAPTYIVADALRLPFGDQSFDAVSMAFGLRNLEDPSQGLREIHRVLRPGAFAVILEFGSAGQHLLGRTAEKLHRWWLPSVGGMVSGNAPAYHYLAGSSESFPSGQQLLDRYASNPDSALGHSSSRPAWEASFRRLFPGTVYLYRLKKC